LRRRHGWAWRMQGCARTWRAGLVIGSRARELHPEHADTKEWGGGARTSPNDRAGPGPGRGLAPHGACVLGGDLDAREQAVRIQQDREALADLGDRVDVVGVSRGNVLE